MRAKDQWGWESEWSPARPFRIDLGLGQRPTQPYDTLGSASVNLANGNLTLTTGGPSFSTVGGPVGVNFTYNSQTPNVRGLWADYHQDSNHNGTIDNNEPSVLHRLDPTLTFNWAADSPDPDSVAADWFLARWKGGLQADVDGQYRLVSKSTDDTVNVKVNGTSVLNVSGCCQAEVVGSPFTLSKTSAAPIEVSYAEGAGAASVRLQIRRVSDGTQFDIPADWLRPTLPSLPDGWSRTGDSFGAGYAALRSVSSSTTVVVDDTGADHQFVWTGSGWQPPPGEDQVLVRSADGAWNLDDDGTLYLFDEGGRLTSVTEATDDIHPGAPTWNWTPPNAGGPLRLTSVTDKTNRQMTLTYGPAPGGPAADCPTASDFDSTAPANMLCRVSYPGFGGGTTDLLYKGGKLARIVNPGNAATDFGYDTNNRLFLVRDVATNDLIQANVFAHGEPQTFNADPLAHPHMSVIQYNSSGQVSAVWSPVTDASAQSATSRAKHSYVYAIGADNRITQADVNVEGLPRPNGYSKRVSIDNALHATQTWDTAGIRTETSWDSFNDVPTATVDHHYQADPTGGLKTTTLYNTAWRPTDTYGPAPAAEFAGQTSATAPHTTTQYDSGYQGLNAAWYNGSSLSGATAAHSLSSGVENWGAGSPIPGAATNLFSGRLTGEITFPGPGTYTFNVESNIESTASLYVNDRAVAGQAVAGQLAAGSSPSVVSQRDPNKTEDMVARGADNSVLISHWTGTTWTPWTNLSNDGVRTITTVYNPAISSWGAGRLDVFATDGAAHVWHRGYDGTTWGGWEDIGAGTSYAAAGAPAAVSWSSGRIDVVFRGTDSGLYHKAYATGSWHPFDYVGCCIASDPTAASWGPNRLDFFARGGDNALWHTCWNGTGWCGWESLGGGLQNAPSAVSWGNLRLDIVLRGTDNVVYHKSYDGTGPGWSTFTPLSGAASSGPGISSVDSQKLDVIVKGTNGELFQKTYGSSGWGADWGQVVPGSRIATYTVNAGDSLTQRIRLDYAKHAGNSSRLALSWKKPGDTAFAAVPVANLKPNYGLVTSTTDADGNTSTTNYGSAPWLGLPNASIKDPTDLALSTQTTYEPAGTGFFRRTSRTLPAQNAWTYSYYGGNADNPCPGGATGINQGGALWKRTAPDPDGAGSATARVEEQVYDAAGRTVASRINTEPWTCVTYDARGRVTQRTIPAFGGEPARTTTYDYAVGGSPAVTAVTDTGVTGSPNGGKVTTTTDWTGRVLQSTDVWNKTTTTTYDQAGRVVATNGPAGAQTFTFTAEGRLQSQTLDGLVIAQPVYHAASGVMTGVNYPSGAGNGGNGTSGSFTFDNRGRANGATWRDPTSTVITSNAVMRKASGDINDETIDGVDADPANPNYVYDGAGRLTAAKVGSHTYAYGFGTVAGCGAGSVANAGRNSNRTSVTDNGTTYTSCYDAADRLLSTQTPGYGTLAYDAHGNTTTLGTETLGYDGADRHVLSTAGSTTVRYVRDASDGIVARTATPASGGGVVSFRAVSSGSTASGTSVAVARPAGTQTGDVLVASIGVSNGKSVSGVPSGWTLVRTVGNGTRVKTSTYWHVAAAGDPGSWSWTVSGTASIAGVIAGYAGVNTSNPIDVSADSTANASASLPAPSVTTTVANDQVLNVFGTDVAAGFTPPGGTTERADLSAGSSTPVSLEVVDAAAAAVGATGVKTATATAAAPPWLDSVGNVWSLTGPGATVSAAGVHLPGSGATYVSAPDSAGLSVTGDLDIRVKVAEDDWAPDDNGEALVTKSGSEDGSWMFGVGEEGFLVFTHTPDSDNELEAASTVPTGFVDGSTHWVRATIDVNNGAGGHDVKFFTSEDGTTWTQLGATITDAGTTSIYDSTSPVYVGAEKGVGNNPATFSAVQIRNGIGGTIVGNWDATNPGTAAGYSANQTIALRPATGGPGTPTTVRYSSGATLDTNNNVIERTIGLPGGVTVTKRTSGTGDVWSYPNLHGDVAATANAAGVKQGSTYTYDPYGNNLNGALPDNQEGNLDQGWIGKRSTEHEPGLKPIIEMGARQYDPVLGRFLEVDPIEGGSCNDYDYVCAEPLNTFDLDGTKLGKSQARHCSLPWNWAKCARANFRYKPRAERFAAKAAVRFNLSPGQQNALRHGLYAALNAKTNGVGFTRAHLHAHEQDNAPSSKGSDCGCTARQLAKDTAVDKRNNEAGIRIGHNSAMTDVQLAYYVQDLVIAKDPRFDYSSPLS